jgi:hypothetical protein
VFVVNFHRETVEGREDEDHHVGVPPTDAERRLETVQPGRVRVEKHELRAKRVDEGESLWPGGSVANNFEARRCGHHSAQTAAENCVVVNNDHTHRHLTQNGHHATVPTAHTRLSGPF